METVIHQIGRVWSLRGPYREVFKQKLRRNKDPEKQFWFSKQDMVTVAGEEPALWRFFSDCRSCDIFSVACMYPQMGHSKDAGAGVLTASYYNDFFALPLEGGFRNTNIFHVSRRGPRGRNGCFLQCHSILWLASRRTWWTDPFSSAKVYTTMVPRDNTSTWSWTPRFLNSFTFFVLGQWI